MDGVRLYVVQKVAKQAYTTWQHRGGRCHRIREKRLVGGGEGRRPHDVPIFETGMFGLMISIAVIDGGAGVCV